MNVLMVQEAVLISFINRQCIYKAFIPSYYHSIVIYINI